MQYNFTINQAEMCIRKINFITFEDDVHIQAVSIDIFYVWLIVAFLA